MAKLNASKRETDFAALKLIEQLYKEGMIEDHIFRNILLQHASAEDMKSFRCTGDKKERGVRSCTEHTG